ncbi:MAG: adaptor protein MecA [Oscillospiraceae bacterium]|nr:adaptor protein MecA [Oscillospiraceae bacterium]
MQIDILSSNTLKLTLSRLDMFDLDIKYESLSGKNPETKRLLAHVLKTIRLDQKVGFDFSCERIFVEAFPRPDGGCMLYVSSLEADSGKKRKSSLKNKEALFEPYEPEDFSQILPRQILPQQMLPIKTIKAGNIKRDGNHTALLIFETEVMSEVGSVCRSLCLQKEWERVNFESSFHMSEKPENKLRLVIKAENSKKTLLSGIIKEFGEVLQGEKELMFTKEHYRNVIETNAVERLRELV